MGRSSGKRLWVGNVPRRSRRVGCSSLARGQRSRLVGRAPCGVRILSAPHRRSSALVTIMESVIDDAPADVAARRGAPRRARGCRRAQRAGDSPRLGPGRLRRRRARRGRRELGNRRHLPKTKGPRSRRRSELGYQQLAGAFGLFLVAVATGEPRPAPVPEAWAAWDISSSSASDRVHFLRESASHTSTSVVMTYAYVNPVVAVILGRVILGESITVWTMGGTVLIVLVVMGVFHERRVSSGREMPGGRRAARDRGTRHRRAGRSEPSGQTIGLMPLIGPRGRRGRLRTGRAQKAMNARRAAPPIGVRGTSCPVKNEEKTSERGDHRAR